MHIIFVRCAVPRSTHSDQYRTLTALLVEARKSAGLTQQQVADRLGKPQSYVAKVEGNERRIDVVEFIALAKVLGVDPRGVFDTLLARIDTP
ncbi:helix-turn-helix domain-containing protein [Pelagibacterium sediminicola]|uniref:helix-turn-helix domain-containing protein n=1 Tax=Pelagibacterium sediminicola TaxID=2248761 RepID=UPI0018E4E7D5|nr:helix-turn-helix transcriptional regulator [Pelagibacterium sediminicola]